MQRKTRGLRRTDNRKLLLPLYGIGLYLFLYILAAWLYPGGSSMEDASAGFSLRDNYWCDLMSNYAKNGALNPARPVALLAWIILCSSLGLFWMYFPRLFRQQNIRLRLIPSSGALAALSALFCFTRFHDLAITLAGVFTTITVVPACLELRRAKQTILFGLAVLCFILGLLNYSVYTTNFYISTLPVLQKVAYALCMVTIGLTSFRIFQQANQNLSPFLPGRKLFSS